MKLCIAGKNNIAVEIAKYSLNYFDKEDVYLITNNSDDGVDTFQRSFLKFAKSYKYNVINLEDIYNVEDLLFLSLEFDRIINPNLFKSNKLFNIHFSMLPKYKGMYTSYWQIKNGEKKSGVTLHKIDKGIDTGDIISQLSFDIDEDMTAKQLYLSCIKSGIELMKDNFMDLVNNNLVSKVQTYLNSSYYSKKSFDYNNIFIDLNQTAIDIKNQIRALNFRDYQLPQINNNSITHAEITNEKSEKKAGQLIFENQFCFKFSTIDFNIVIYKDCLDTLLEYCKLGKNCEVEEILNMGYDVNEQNYNGWTPLIVACYNGQIDIVKTLIKYGANINKTNYNGTTPLMYAKEYCIKNNNYQLFKYLLKKRADFTIKDNDNKDIFDYTKEQYRSEKLVRLRQIIAKNRKDRL